MEKEIQSVVEGTGLIEQAQAEHETIREQIVEYYQQARELRYQADKLNSRDEPMYNDKSKSVA